ncbi:hypothetical protein BP6252_08954 [Coleophoma cylindrospora]|uniref:Alpha-L-rhamnosidase C-terminal domain-containing protein n=1 Tax=Coleophoma cylindrospora TaxID=1849047 RepID=A0A3D8R0S8_9HELO|nr:hypothetical protein BP6252_08954 [Coleophoma cylindrospora]
MSTLPFSWVSLLCAVTLFCHLTSSTLVPPVSSAIGSKPSLSDLSSFAYNASISPTSPILTLDYGSEVLGTPTFDVVAVSGPSQFEFKYSEEFAGLNNKYGDGPWTFANGLSNTFRTETFNITEPGSYASYFLQGGLRWQSVKLLTNTTVTFSQIGLDTKTTILPNDQLPGFFNASKSIYSDIWGLGAKTVQAACVDNASLVSTWEVTDQGVLLHGQEPAQSAIGVNFSNYTMSFLTKIVRGGTGWRVASSIIPYGPYFVLTSNYPQDTSFLNTDTELLPPSSLVTGYGFSLVNQTTLTSGPVTSQTLNMTINEDQWYEINTTISSNGYKISINGTLVATISYDEAETWPSALFGPPSAVEGTWGFGPFQDQVAYVKDVSVFASNGTILYENPMTSTSILEEYGVAPNQLPLCLDGSKRDRVVWLGDFVHTARTVLASTNRTDHIFGVVDFEFAFQIDSGTGAGYTPTSAPMGSSPSYKTLRYPVNYAIDDYQIFFMVSLGDLYRTTGNLDLFKEYWNQTKLLSSAMLDKIDPITGLMGDTGSYFFSGAVNGTAPSALMVIALNQLVVVAEALGDTATAVQYKSAAANISTAVNSLLWNEEIGSYSYSLAAPTNISAASVAFAIRSGIANTTQASLSIASLSALKYGCGYLTDNTAPGSNSSQLSPNILGFLLESLFIANTTLSVPTLEVAKDLLDNFWSMMVTQNEYYSGATWEYLYPNGAPGIDLFTSLAHPWGSAPTYVLEEYVLGVSSLEAGYKKWKFQPLLYGLELDFAEGVIPVPGGSIFASWKLLNGSRVQLEVEAPAGTTGIIELPSIQQIYVESGSALQKNRSEISVNGGDKVVLYAIL